MTGAITLAIEALCAIKETSMMDTHANAAMREIYLASEQALESLIAFKDGVYPELERALKTHEKYSDNEQHMDRANNEWLLKFSRQVHHSINDMAEHLLDGIA